MNYFQQIIIETLQQDIVVLIQQKRKAIQIYL